MKLVKLVRSMVFKAFPSPYLSESHPTSLSALSAPAGDRYATWIKTKGSATCGLQTLLQGMGASGVVSKRQVLSQIAVSINKLVITIEKPWRKLLVVQLDGSE